MASKARTRTFKKRYVLGEGYPWAIGESPYRAISLSKQSIGISLTDLEWPEELWYEHMPKYRLVLEKVEDAK